MWESERVPIELTDESWEFTAWAGRGDRSDERGGSGGRGLELLEEVWQLTEEGPEEVVIWAYSDGSKKGNMYM